MSDFACFIYFILFFFFGFYCVSAGVKETGLLHCMMCYVNIAHIAFFCWHIEVLLGYASQIEEMKVIIFLHVRKSCELQ
jgi:hypothetical protein